MHRINEKPAQNFVFGNTKARAYLGDLGVDGSCYKKSEQKSYSLL
jgi:hypothetical protein